MFVFNYRICEEDTPVVSGGADAGAYRFCWRLGGLPGTWSKHRNSV